MSEVGQLRIDTGGNDQLLLPAQCSISVSCYETQEVQQAVIGAIEQIFYALAAVGMDLRALDGITMSHDCRADATALQQIPEGQIPLEMTDQPDTMEMARTVAVWRDKELRFHIMFRAGIGLMTLSSDTELQTVAHACIAHEAAHVEHERHLWKTFPNIYGRPLECGDRSRQTFFSARRLFSFGYLECGDRSQQTFLKAMDVWSEYAACRSSAMFRPEAVEEFEGIFCRALEASLTASAAQIAAYRRDRDANEVFTGLQQLFGDVFIHAGYFLGHLDGLELRLEDDAPRAAELLQNHPQIQPLIVRLRRVLHELWLNEYGWESIEVFAPIYDLICEMMALNGMALAKSQKNSASH